MLCNLNHNINRRKANFPFNISITEMDFHTLSRRQLQALCRRNRIPANLTNLAMADSLNALNSVEGIEEILNDIPQSPMVPPTSARSRAVGALETPGATVTRRRAAAVAGSAFVRRQINESLDETEEVKRDVCVKTPAPAPASRRRMVKETSTVKPVYSTRRSARLALKIQDPNQISESIKNSSFNEDEGGSVNQTETSEITVADSSKVSSEESEVKSNDESAALSEVTSGNSNGADVPVAILEQKTETDIKADAVQQEDGLMKLTEEVCRVETEEDYNEDTKVNSSVAQETKAIIEHTETVSNVDSEVKASFEVTDVNEEATLVKDAQMKSEAVYEDSGMKTIVDEEPKAAFEDSEMKINVDEVSEKVKASTEDTEMESNVDEETDMNSKEDEEIDIAESEGHMVVNVTVGIPERKEEPNENETSEDEESDISESDDDFQEEMIITEAEIQGGQEKDELVDSKDNNVESTISAIGGDTPLNKTPKNVGRLIQISDDKEIVKSGRKSVVVKVSKKKNQLEDCSLRQLTKMFKKKLEITKQEDGKEDIIKATTTRPALKPLAEMED